MLLAEVERALDAVGVERCGVLVAVSGGIDSTVLAHALAAVAPRRALALAIGHVNHGLRGDASDGDERAVAALASALDVPFHVRRVAPDSLREGVASRARPTLQEAARTLRRDALRALAREAGASRVATAHQADDQAETVLMRLLRGCSADSLGGIAEASADGVFVRPLLAVPRREVAAYADAHGLAWRDDASNRDARYTRSRLRRDLLPALARDYNPRLLRVVGDLAEAQRRDTEWLESLVGAEAERRFASDGDVTRIDADGWRELPEALARRLVRRLFVERGGGRDVRRVHLLRAVAFLGTETPAGRPEAVLELPDGLRLVRTARGFELSRRADPPAG